MISTFAGGSCRIETIELPNKKWVTTVILSRSPVDEQESEDEAHALMAHATLLEHWRINYRTELTVVERMEENEEDWQREREAMDAADEAADRAAEEEMDRRREGDA